MEKSSGTEEHDLVVQALGLIEKRVHTAEGDGILARWEFGRELLTQRVGAQLPRGLRSTVARKFELGNTEIAQRMQFAERFATEQDVFACANTYRTWNRIKREVLPASKQAVVEVDWATSAKLRLDNLVDKLLVEAGGHDDRHEALVSAAHAVLQRFA